MRINLPTLLIMIINLANCFVRRTSKLSIPISQGLRSIANASTIGRRVDNPVALVTGSSRGIGKAIAIALAEVGCKVVVNYSSNEDAANLVCEEINSRGVSTGGFAMPFKANCANFDEVKAMFQRVNKELGPVEILVNNAGITKDMLTMRMSPTDFNDVISLNLNGAFYCSKIAFSDSMLRLGRGKIVNIASIVGQVGNSGQANYAAAKGGMIAMTKSMAKEFGSRNICVNAVCPGFIESDMTKDLKKDVILPTIPLKRFGTAQEVAGVVKFLALDPAANYITGHCFNVDGGLAIGAT